MDELDRRIIALLVEDGRMSNNEIARKLKISEGTVRNRIRKLVDSGMLKVSGLVSPDAVSEKQLFFLGIKVAVSKDLSIISEKISKLAQVQSAYITTGRYDIIIEVWLPVKSGLIDFLCGPLSSIGGIVSTETFLVMKSYGKWVQDQVIVGSDE